MPVLLCHSQILYTSSLGSKDNTRVAAQVRPCCPGVAARLGKATSELNDTGMASWWSAPCHSWVVLCSGCLSAEYPTRYFHLVCRSVLNHCLAQVYLHLRDVTFIMCHLLQMPQETHAKSSSNWKKLKGVSERHSLAFSFSLGPGKGMKRVAAGNAGFIQRSGSSHPVL